MDDTADDKGDGFPAHNPLLSTTADDPPPSLARSETGELSPLGDEDALGSAPEALLENMEPSLELYWGSPNEHPTVEPFPASAPDGDIEFPSSHNSPEIPGSTSHYLSRWEPHYPEPQTPRSELSERSLQSSFYAMGSTRTSTAGGLELRTLVRSSEPKAGLDTGDVVMLLSQGRPYIAVQAQLPYKDDAWHVCLELTEEGVAPESEGLAYLEVVRSGSYIGFRSGAAGNRFVQPRRKSPHRLVFFNQNCGIWEHWEVVGDAWLAAPWSQLPMVFRHRQLALLELCVDVVRVGHLALPPGAGTAAPGSSTSSIGGANTAATGLSPLTASAGAFAPTPRSLALPVIPEEDHVEDTNLTRMSNLLLMEWFKFVDTEKLVRAGVEADVTALKEDLTEFKINSIRQIEFLRSSMNEEVDAMRSEVASRHSDLTFWQRRWHLAVSLCLSRARMRKVLLRWRRVTEDRVYRKTALIKLTRKRERETRRRLLLDWLHTARKAAGLANKLSFTLQRRCHALMSRALLGWHHLTAHRQWRGRTILAVGERRAAHRLSAAFASWRLETVQRGAGRAALQRALQGVRKAALAAVLTAWREGVAAAARKEVQAELFASRRADRLLAAVILSWRDVAYLGHFLARHARAALLRRTLAALRGEVTAAGARQRAAAVFAAGQDRGVLRGALHAWRDTAARRATRGSVLRAHVLRRSSALQGRVLAGWRRLVRQLRRQRVALQRHMAVVRQRQAATLLAAWRAFTVRRAWQRSRLITALNRTATQRMSTAMRYWYTYTSARRATRGRGNLVASRIRRQRLAAYLGRWRQLTVRLRLARQRLGALCRKLQGSTLSSSFREWRLLTGAAVSSRAAAARALPASTRALLAQLLGTWWARHCITLPPTAAAAIATPGFEASQPRRGLSQGSGRAPVSSSAPAGRAAAKADPGGGFGEAPLVDTVAFLSPPQQQQSPAASQQLAGAGAPPALQSGGASQLPTASATASPARPDTNRSVPESRELSFSLPAAGGSPQQQSAPFVAYGNPLRAGGASSLIRGSATSSPARPPLHPAITPPSSSPISSPPTELATVTAAAGGSPGIGTAAPLSSILSTLTPTQHSRGTTAGSRRSSSSGSGFFAGGSGGVDGAVLTPSSGGASSISRTPGRSYREALVAGAGATGHITTPWAGAAAATSTSTPSSRSSSTGRMRSAGGGGGSVAPFVPANAAVIGAGSSPVLVEMAPGRVGEGPLTPVGIPELLLDGEEVEEHLDTAVAAAQNTQAQVAVDGFPKFSAAAAAPETAEPARSRARSVGSAVAVDGAGGAVSLSRWLATAVLLHWRRVVSAHRQWVSKLEAVAEGLRRQAAREVLAAWRGVVVASQGRMEAAVRMAVRAAARGQRQALQQVLVCWQAVAHRGTVLRSLLARHSARSAVVTAGRVLAGWRGVAEERLATRRKVARMISRQQAASVDRIFHAWSREAADGAARRSTASQLASSQHRHLMWSTLAGWRGAAVERRERAARQARAARLAARRRLAGAFRSWRGAAEAATERQEVAERASRASTLRAAFGSWLQAASGPVGTLGSGWDAAMHRAACWHSRRLMRSCLRALEQHMRECRQQCMDVRAWSDLRVAEGVLEAWRAEAVVSRRAVVEVTKMRARTSKRLLSCVFAAWLGHVDDLCTSRLTAETLAARQDRRILSDALECWWAVTRGSVEKRQRRNALLMAAARRVEGVLLRHVLAHWSATTCHLRALRAEATRRVAARSHALISLAFAAWLDLALHLRDKRRQAQTRGSVADRALLCQALARWGTAVVSARERAEAAEAMAEQRARAVLLPRVLRAWAGLAGGGAGLRTLQRSALAHLLLRRCLGLQRRAFEAWRSAVAETLRVRDELRRCVKRKKLAFSLFKQWYWQAFDTDVQATIRRMFHSTDPAAHSPVPTLRGFMAGAPAATTTAAAAGGRSKDWQHQQHQQFPYHNVADQQHPSAAVYDSRRTTASSYGRSSFDPTASGYYDPASVPRSGRTLAAAVAAAAAPGRPISGLSPVPQPQSGPQTRHRARHAAPVCSASSLHSIPQQLQRGQIPQAQAGSQKQQYQPQQEHQRQASRGSGVASSDRGLEPEPIRSLAPSFDHLVSRAPGQAGAGAGVAGSGRSQEAAARGAAAGTGAGGSRGTGSTRPASMYALWRPSDSDESDPGTDEAAMAATAAVAPGGRGGKGDPAAGAPSAGRAGPAASRGPANKREVAFGRAVGTAPPPAKPAAAGGSRPAASTASGGLAGPLASGGSGAGNSSWDAVTAMNAVLVNVASQLTEVSRASLEIAAGVVASSGAAAAAVAAATPPPGVPGGRPHRATTGSIGSGGGGVLYYTGRGGSIDGSYGSGSVGLPTTAAAATVTATIGGSPHSAGSPSLAATLSPLSPIGALAPYVHQVYGNNVASVGTRNNAAATASGGELPGVLPSWRQVAVNQLYDMDWRRGGSYDEDEENDLGPVDPMLVGIAGAGTAPAGGDLEAVYGNDDDDGTEYDGETEPTGRSQSCSSGNGGARARNLATAAVAVRAESGSGSGSISVGPSRAASESSSRSYPPYSTYRNGLFQRQEDQKRKIEREE